ncbi:hypothetical protein MNBD_ALPHA02-1752 [hydrothermal vent metagenome]|uniref:Methyltransferase FkbM domain-containing protein n=1 Tax=hydrothermal vent metagenome TaxID=652676 RepID=A0A3B0S2N0_9ZZZZ
MLIKILYKFFPRILFSIRKLIHVNEESEMKLLYFLCQGNKTSLDVGAKFGMYTHRLNNHSNKVIAFEPIKELSGALSKIFGRENVDIMPLALSDNAGSVSMRTPIYKSGNPCYGRSSIEIENHLEFEKTDGWEEFTVETTRLDDLTIKDIGFIKIDVEGHEQAVLAGAVLTIQKYRPAMLIEANNSHLPQAIEKLFNWAEKNDYLVFFMFDEKIMSIEKYNIEYHHHQKGLENFILLHANDELRIKKLKLAS